MLVTDKVGCLFPYFLLQSLYPSLTKHAPACGLHMSGFLILIVSTKSVYIYICVCLPSRLVITNGMTWTLSDWLNKFYSFCTAATVDIVSRSCLIIEACQRKQPNKSKLALYKSLLNFYNHIYKTTVHKKYDGGLQL